MTKFEEKYVYTYPLQPKLWKRFTDDIFLIWLHGMDSVLEFINHLNTVHSTIKFTKEISPTEIPFLDLIIYIKGSRLYIRLHTKATDRCMYLNFCSEHPMSLNRSILYSQFLRLKRIHTEPQFLLEAQIHMYLFFIWKEYPHDTILKAWKQTNETTRDQLLFPKETNLDKKMPLMFITTYSRSNPKFKELLCKHWSHLGRPSATRELGKRTSWSLIGIHLPLRTC